MVQVKAKYDGRVLIPAEPLDVPAGTELCLTIDDAARPASPDLPPLLPAIDPATDKRRLGQQRGAVLHMSDDFNDHLGDDFWFGKQASAPSSDGEAT